MVTSRRPMSPATQRVDEPMRASTGTMQLSASYNDPPSEYPATRPGHNAYAHPSEYTYSSSYDSRANRSPPLETHPVTSAAYRNPDLTAKSRTEYALRPRSSTASAADGRPPHPLRISMDPTTAGRPYPVVTPTYAPPTTAWPPYSERYTVPASRQYPHRRVYNVDANGNSRLVVPRRAREYSPMESSSQWYSAEGSRKGQNIDDYDAYSYVEPSQQFERDSIDRVGHIRRTHPRERPSSVTGAEDLYHPQRTSKKEPRAHHGPPPSQRGFDKVDRYDRDGYLYRSAHVESDHESSGSRRSWQKAPVLHHDWDDGQYYYRDGYYDDSRRRHRPRRHHHDDHGHRRSRRHTHGDPSAGYGTGLGTAGLASGYEKTNYDMPPEKDCSPHEHGHRRHRSRSRVQHRRREESNPDAYASDDDLSRYQREPSARHRPTRLETYTRPETLNGSAKESSPQPHRRPTSRSRTRVDENSGKAKEADRQTSGSSQEESRKSTGSSTPPSQPDPPLKGILKPPREKFPEEPNPVREGVAPLKDAHKEGIPTDARWTKVLREIVNPAALELGHERFEERRDYVIVLRVLREEEIRAYAVLTQEIRDKRYQEYKEQQRRKREGRRRRTGDSSDSSDEGDEDSREREPLTLEAPPTQAH